MDWSILRVRIEWPNFLNVGFGHQRFQCREVLIHLLPSVSFDNNVGQSLRLCFLLVCTHLLPSLPLLPPLRWLMNRLRILRIFFHKEDIVLIWVVVLMALEVVTSTYCVIDADEVKQIVRRKSFQRHGAALVVVPLLGHSHIQLFYHPTSQHETNSFQEDDNWH